MVVSIESVMVVTAGVVFGTRFSKLPPVAPVIVVLVTHRASLLSLVDRLLVVDRGQILADGPKAVVMEALKKGQISVA